MTLKIQTCSKGFYSKGMTLIELLVVLSVAAIVLAFAVPSMEGASARADIKAASENVSQAFRMAKNTARITNSPVTITLTTGTSANRILFTSPGNVAVSTDGLIVQDIALPENISVVADPAAFTFDSMGMIVGFTALSTIELASTVDSSQAVTVSIVNGLGNVTIARNSSS